MAQQVCSANGPRWTFRCRTSPLHRISLRAPIRCSRSRRPRRNRTASGPQPWGDDPARWLRWLRVHALQRPSRRLSHQSPERRNGGMQVGAASCAGPCSRSGSGAKPICLVFVHAVYLHLFRAIGRLFGYCPEAGRHCRLREPIALSRMRMPRWDSGGRHRILLQAVDVPGDCDGDVAPGHVGTHGGAVPFPGIAEAAAPRGA